MPYHKPTPGQVEEFTRICESIAANADKLAVSIKKIKFSKASILSSKN